ncbi:MAG: DUF1015 family protein [Acidobacteria bacterium]|nr:DUF1015 family protein [Acidobacteriota bacterium]
MPPFAPFRGIRFDLTSRDPRSVTAPPYDVISPEQRRALVADSDESIVRIDLPIVDPDHPEDDPYRAAAALFEQWRRTGVLLDDERPSFTVYRMIALGEDGSERQTTGVIGALQLSAPDEGHILCHEFTTPKARSDRLDLLAATDANLSPIWGLSPVTGLTDLLATDDPPLMDFEVDGVRHTVWTITEPERLASISASVGAGPIVIADGHHRYETSLAHRDRIRRERGGSTGAEAVMCFVVELVAEQLSVEPIHRLVSGLDPATDLLARLEEFFEIEPFPAPSTGVVAALQAAGALALITPEREVLLRPRPERFTETRDLDSSRLDLALGALGDVDVVYQHGVEEVRDAVATGAASFGVLLRPVTIEQILAIADGGERMPPKSTFFAPKPRTGVVLRSLRD